LKILKGLEAAVEVVKGILKQYDSDSYRYVLIQDPIVLYYSTVQQVYNFKGLQQVLTTNMVNIFSSQSTRGSQRDVVYLG
jgi:hypothetical protein